MIARFFSYMDHGECLPCLSDDVIDVLLYCGIPSSALMVELESSVHDTMTR